ncbi:MAG: ribose 5-phosphate isomerase B [Propionibacteriaceae bacterium]|nr:ribose 5-phosphate isomerase B [Propionibacteriaceae bacterium]
MTRVAVGADAAGFALKEQIIAVLVENGYEYIDAGTDGPEPMVDYPDFAFKVCELVARQEADSGVLVCGTGIGMSIAANKIPGIRAALCHDAFGARLSRAHNDANVLAFGAWDMTAEKMAEILPLWLSTHYDAGRHVPRLRAIREKEGERLTPGPANSQSTSYGRS